MLKLSSEDKAPKNVEISSSSFVWKGCESESLWYRQDIDFRKIISVLSGQMLYSDDRGCIAKELRTGEEHVCTMITMICHEHSPNSYATWRLSLQLLLRKEKERVRKI